MPSAKRNRSLPVTPILLLGGTLALAAPTAVHAATAGVEAAGPRPVAAPAQATDEAGTGKKKVQQLAPVIVTAQGRRQELQNVPIAIQVVEARSLETHTADNIADLNGFIPGLSVDATQPTQPRFRIRGIGGAENFGIGTSPTVGVYVDGVYQGGTGAALLDFNDVKRIEVLKGPQGTLFGRNAAAGAVSVITNRPDPAKFAADGEVRFGNHGQRWVTAMVNAPVSQDMAFRLSVVGDKSDGWVRNQVNGEHYGRDNDWGFRGSWLWNPGNTQFWLTWSHERLNQPARPNFGLIPTTIDPGTRAPFPPDPDTYLDPRHAPLYNEVAGSGENRQYDQVALHMDHFMDWATFSTITAWRRFHTYNRDDFGGSGRIDDYFGTTNREANMNWYQEFKLQGETPLANWLAGASWYHENASQASETNLLTNTIDSLVLNLGVPTGTPDGTIYNYFNSLLQQFGLPFRVLGDPWTEQILNHLDGRSYAVYGDVIWHLTDHLDLTTGARVTRDVKRFSWLNPVRSAPELDQTIDSLERLGILAAAGVSPGEFRQNVVFTSAVGLPVQASNSWTDFSPRVVLAEHFTPHVMGYISAAKGYKSGGYDSVEIGSQFQPEKVWNFEAGIKTEFPEYRLVFNASFFHYRYSNLQSLFLLPDATPSGIPQYVVSSSNQQANGLDFEAQWHPVEALGIHINGSYLDSTFQHDVAPDGTDLSGQPTGAPVFSAAAGIEYRWQLAGGALTWNLDQAHIGPTRCNASSQLQGTCRVSPNFPIGQSMNLTDLRLGWSAPHDRWGVALYATNLFNHRYVVQVNNISTSVLGTPFGFITPPRMFGVALHARY